MNLLPKTLIAQLSLSFLLLHLKQALHHHHQKKKTKPIKNPTKT